MSKKIIMLFGFLLPVFFVMSQPPKTAPNQFPTTIPKHETAKVTANVKQIKKPSLSSFITTTQWKGSRIWYAANSATVDSVSAIKFNIDGSVTWQKQGWEFATKTAGTYTISGSNITINFDYAPYKHLLQGSYNESTGKISGSFTETRSSSPNAPSAYSAGITQGEFNFYKQ